MSKRVLILSGSPRRGGNSDLLCDEFMRGALESGNIVEKIFIRDKNIGYCNACAYCLEHDGKCIIDDAMGGIVENIKAADVIVLSSPVYFFAVDAQLKTVIDRLECCYEDIPNKEFYYIMTAQENDEHTWIGTIMCFRGLLECMVDPVEKGYICAGGLWESGKVIGTPYMQQAYEMGKGI